MAGKRGRPRKQASQNGTSSKKEEEKVSKKSKRTEDDGTSTSEQPDLKKAKTEGPKQLMNKIDTNLDAINFDSNTKNADSEDWNLKITSWNVSGLRAVLKKGGAEYIEKEDADIIALQETKCDKNQIPEEIKLKGYEHYFLDSKKSGYCGVGLLTKVKPIDVKYSFKGCNCNDEGRIITAEYEKFYLINVYVPNAGQKLVTLPKRLEWNELFKKYVMELDKKKPVIVVGDMNVAHKEIDLKNPKTNTKNAGFTKEEREGMTDFLSVGFVDTFRMLYPDKVDAYTFWSYFNNARGKNIGWRLDYYIVSERIKRKICDVVNRYDVYGSDHCPVVCYLTI